MRRTYVLLIGFGLVVATPGPALAWWDFIEQFSGPRKFYGWDLQLRLFCLVDVTRNVLVYEPPTAEEIKEQEKDSKQTPPVRARVVSQTRPEMVTAAPVGLLLSVCKAENKDKERLMFDLGARFMTSKEYENDTTPDFANGRKIRFTTLEPAVMFPVAKGGGWRLDYGFGAGVYWFSSEGFQSFNGAFLEPVRFDLHLPIKFWKVNAIIVRGAGLYFPAGFDATAFAGGPGHDQRIEGEWVPTYSVFADLTPVAKAVTEKLKLRWAD